MTFFRLLFRTLYFYCKDHALLLVGLMLSSAVLTTALIIGDSMKFSLNRNAQLRLGKTTHIVHTQEKFMPVHFTYVLSDALSSPVAPVLQLRGIAGSDAVERKAGNVQIFGIDERFWIFGNSNMPELTGDNAIINKRLAEKLKIDTGDEIFVRVEKTSYVSNNVPFVPSENNSMAFRCKIVAVADENSFGNFSIETNQVTKPSIFLSIEKLSQLNFDNNICNILLIENTNISSAEIDEKIKKNWTLDVINAQIRNVDYAEQIELISDEVFLKDTILQVLKQNNLNPQPAFTYLVNEISTNDKSTPYSFVSALSDYPEFKPDTNEIIINTWLADDLKLGLNDTVQLKYYTLGAYRRLIEKTEKFVVKHITGISGYAADSMLMPGFDGFKGVDRCSDWDAGIPIDYSKIRDKDEMWWKQYKGTPKAFISYQTAVALWKNSFGNATAIRFDNNIQPDAISKTILSNISPSNVGILISDIRSEAGWSANNAVDFAQLFLSLGFFLILATILLSALLFWLMLSKRTQEQNVLRAMGIHPKMISKLYVSEGLLITIVSGIAGVFVGILVNQLLLNILNSAWNDIVRTNLIFLKINVLSLIIGFVSNLLLFGIVIYVVMHSFNKKSIKSMRIPVSENATRYKIISVTAFIAFVIVFGYSYFSKSFQNSTLFLISGFLLLVSILNAFAFSVKNSGKLLKQSISVSGIAFRNLNYNFNRNILITAILAIGVFMVITTGSYRTDFTQTARENSSGTGGFTHFIETSISLNADLNTTEGKETLALPEEISGASFVQMLQNKNDDASCLNLNRIIRPTILGVKPELLLQRNSFSFVNALRNDYKSWSVLNIPLSSNCIPAVADQSVITWGLGKSLGDSIMYVNEKGETIYLVLVAGIANSVLQGNILISEENFTKHFPSISGSNIILADLSEDEFLIEELESSLQMYGAEIQSTTERLEVFNSVTNTYLDIFMALGVIAFIIGTIGIAVVIFKSISDQKRNIAMLQAIGIPFRKIKNIYFTEFLVLMLTGIFSGSLASFFAGFHTFLLSNAGIPVMQLIVILIVFALNGILWVWAGTKLSIKTQFVDELRNE